MTLAEIFCLAVLSLSVGDSKKNSEFACSQMDLIVRTSVEHRIRPEVLVSLIHHESRFNPGVVSQANACGLTQVIPKYTGSKKTGVKKLSCQDLKDPEVSIIAGTKTLNYWVYKYGKGSEKIGLCGYNAGFRCRPIKDKDGKKSLLRAGKRGMVYSRNVLKLADKLKRAVAKIRSDRGL